MTDFEVMSNGFIDFFSWFFGTFLKGVSDFLFGSSFVDGINLAISKVGEFLNSVGLSSLGVSQIALPTHVNNLIIIVSVSLFLGLGVGLFLLLKKVLFGWM